MLRKIVDVLKEVFWLKPSRSRKKGKPSRRIKSKKLAVKKKIVKKPAKIKLPKKFVAKPKVIKKEPTKALLKKSKAQEVDASLVEVGVITHYFEKIKVCVLKLTSGSVLIGDKLMIMGPKTKFVQKVWSMQIESVDVKVAKKGQLIGLKVDKLVAVGDKVYK